MNALPSVISILVVDDHPLICEGLREVISSQPDMCVVGEASNGEEAIRAYKQLQPDVTLMDIGMPVLDGVGALCAIRSEQQNARIIMLTTYKGDVQILRAVQAGASGFLLKNTLRENLLNTIRSVHMGQRCIPAEIAIELTQHMGKSLAQSPLSARETEVLSYAADGNSNRRIAKHLSISEETVKAHMKNVLAKLAAHCRTQAVVIALKRGIITT